MNRIDIVIGSHIWTMQIFWLEFLRGPKLMSLLDLKWGKRILLLKGIILWTIPYPST